jgi:hypothetical protein
VRVEDWQDEHDLALSILPDARLVWVLKNYIAFRILGDDFSLVVYPHKTSAGNHHARVRDENSKNKLNAVIAMKKLYEESGHNCTFQAKKYPDIPGREIRDKKEDKYKAAYEKAVEALEYYARKSPQSQIDTSVYPAQEWHHEDSEFVGDGIFEIGGKRARQALKECKEILK